MSTKRRAACLLLMVTIDATIVDTYNAKLGEPRPKTLPNLRGTVESREDPSPYGSERWMKTQSHEERDA